MIFSASKSGPQNVQMQVLFPPWAALGVSNSDPYAGEPDKSDDWVKEGPHLMIVVPDSAMLEGLSTNPADPVYVMWKDTPYAHIMVKIAAD